MLNKARAVLSRSRSSEIVRGSIGTAILKGAGLPLSFVLAIVLARALGVEEYGAYSYIFALITILSLPSQFGLPTLVVRETSRSVAEKDWARIKGLWRWSTFFVIISSGVVIVVAIVLKTLVPQFIEKNNTILWWGLALIPMLALGNLRGAALRGLRKVVQGQLPEKVIRPAVFILLLLSVTLMMQPDTSLSAEQAMMLHLLAAVVAFSAGVYLLKKEIPNHRWKSEVSHYEGRRWIRSAVYLGIGGSLQVISNNTDMLMLGMIETDKDVGLFRVAMQMSLLVAFVQQTLSLVLAPHFARLYARRELSSLEALFRRSAQVIAVVTLPVFVLIVSFSEVLVEYIFGAEYVSAAVALIILAAAKFIHAIFGPIGFLLSMSGHERDTARILAVCLIANIALNLWWIPVWGIEGAAGATLVSWVLMTTMFWWAAWRRLNIQCMILLKPAQK